MPSDYLFLFGQDAGKKLQKGGKVYFRIQFNKRYSQHETEHMEIAHEVMEVMEHPDLGTENSQL